MTIGKMDLMYAKWKKATNKYKNSIDYIIHKSGLKYTLLHNNLNIKNKFLGNRCFIVGNGPSTKEQVLSVLREEYVFTVNYAANGSQFLEMKTDFHFWTDPNIFNVSSSAEELEYLIKSIKAVKTTENNPYCFVPIEEYQFIKENKLDKELQFFYLSPSLGWMYEGFDELFQLEKNIPQFGTVVQFCIVAAIYMGFNQIYLLGCDNTGILNTVKALEDCIDENNYGYDITSLEKRRMRSGVVRNGLETEVRSYFYNIKGFRILGEYCRRRGIRLCNCSVRSVIDSLERCSLNSIIG